MKGLFSKKPKEKTREDAFQNLPPKKTDGFPIDFEEPHENEVLLEGKIGVTPGAPAAPEPALPPEKEERKPEEEKKNPSSDTLEKEYAQTLKEEINKSI